MVDSGADMQRIPRQIRQDARYRGFKAKDVSDHERPGYPWAQEQCERLGLDPAGVCRRAFDDGPVATFLAYAQEIKRKSGRPYTLRGLSERMLADTSDVEDARREMRAIDDLRLDDPTAAASYARKALAQVGGPIATSYVVGAMASAHLQQFRLNWATVELAEALSWADVAEHRMVVAELMRRAVCTLRDRGKLDEAEAMARHALSICESEGDEPGAAYCQVELAITFRNRSRPRAAIRRLHAGGALKMNRARYRYAVDHNLALCWIDLGDLKKAEKAAAKARRQLPPGAMPRAFLAWLRARIASKAGRYEAAAGFFNEVYDVITDPPDRLLIGAEWTHALIQGGNHEQGAWVAEKMLALHRPLKADPFDERRILSAAAMDLALAGRRARISANRVSAVLKTIHLGRKQRGLRMRRQANP